MEDNGEATSGKGYGGIDKGKAKAIEVSMKTKESVGSSTTTRITEAPEMIIRRAKIYQEHMKNVPIPSVIPNTLGQKCKTWEELTLGMEELYKQPLHYLTHVIVKEWDKSRDGAENEKQPIGQVINPVLAQATIWFIEQVHRVTTSPIYLARLWFFDPNYVNFC